MTNDTSKLKRRRETDNDTPVTTSAYASDILSSTYHIRYTIVHIIPNNNNVLPAGAGTLSSCHYSPIIMSSESHLLIKKKKRTLPMYRSLELVATWRRQAVSFLGDIAYVLRAAPPPPGD